MSRQKTLLLAGVMLFGCSGAETPPIAPTPLLETVAASPVAASFSIEESIAVSGAISAIGTSVEGHPIFHTDGRVYELTGGAVEWRPLYAEGDDPTAIGTVRTIVARNAGGAWIAGDDRLFIADSLYVIASPLVLDAGAVHAIDDVESGVLAGLWIGTDDGLFQRTDDALVTWTVPGVSGAVTGVAIEDRGRFGLAIIDGTLVTLETNGADVLTDRGVVDIGEVRAVAAAVGAVWAAGANGIVRFSADESPPYRLYTLGGAADVYAITTDPVTGHAWGRTPTSLVRIDGTDLQIYDAPMIADRTAALAVDMLGDVFSAGETTLERNGTGATGGAISFDADVKPWIQTHCSQCHMNQTQNFEAYDVFVGLAAEALSRVRTGDMPRCAGGIRCSNDEALTPTDYAVLEKWLRDGSIE